MERIKKFLCYAFVVVAVMLFARPVHATSLLPWLDFGNTLVWDTGTSTLTDNGSTYVTSVKYLDGSDAVAYSGDPVLGTVAASPPYIWPDDFTFSPVLAELSLSFDGDNTNDTLKLTDGTTDWLTADLEIIGPTPDPLAGTPNPYTVLMKGSTLSVATGLGSQWADEFYSVLGSGPTPAQIQIGFIGGTLDLGGGKYEINASTKVIPNPEPGTLLLLGSGLLGLGLMGRKKRRV